MVLNTNNQKRNSLDNPEPFCEFTNDEEKGVNSTLTNAETKLKKASQTPIRTKDSKGLPG